MFARRTVTKGADRRVADRAFADSPDTRFNEAAARLAWTRTLAFPKAHL